MDMMGMYCLVFGLGLLIGVLAGQISVWRFLDKKDHHTLSTAYDSGFELGYRRGYHTGKMEFLFGKGFYKYTVDKAREKEHNDSIHRFKGDNNS